MNKIIGVFLFCFVLAIGSWASAQNNAAAAKPENLKPAIAVGETAPDFALASSGGGTVTLSKVGGPTILVFYRGYW